MIDPSGCCNHHSPSVPLFCSQGAASSEMLPEAGLGQVSLAAGSGSAVHSCARLAASPAVLLMPLHSPGSGHQTGCTLAGCGCPRSIPVVPACCDEQGVVLLDPQGLSLVGVQGEGWQRAVPSVLPQPPRLVVAPEGSEPSRGQLGPQPGSAAGASRHGLPCVPAARREEGQRGAVPDRAGSMFRDKRFILEGGKERTPDLLFQSPGLQRDRLS